MSDARPLFSTYDAASAGYTYGVYGPVVTSGPFLITVGSSTTVSESVASENTFVNFGLQDLIYVRGKDNAVTTRKVTGVGSIPDSVTVDAAVDWSTAGGTPFSFRRWSSGIAAESGWFSTGDYEYKSVEIVLTTLAATSVDYSIEGRSYGGAAVTHSIAALTATGGYSVNILTPFDQMRVGLKVVVDGGVQSVTVNFYGRR